MSAITLNDNTASTGSVANTNVKNTGANPEASSNGDTFSIGSGSTNNAENIGAKAKASSVEQQYSTQRIRKELSEINMPPRWVLKVKPDNLYEWNCIVPGPYESYFDGGVISLNIRFPKQYPFKPPTVLFCKKTNSRGLVPLDILKQKWTPKLTISTVIYVIYKNLRCGTPNTNKVCKMAEKYVQYKKTKVRTPKKWMKPYVPSAPK